MQRDQPDTGRPITETRRTGDDVGRYDADAEFKRPVPKPEGYLPDDTGGRGTAQVAPREHGHWDGWTNKRDLVDVLDRASCLDRAGTPRPQEPAEGDRGDSLHAAVDQPTFLDPNDDRSPDRYGDPLTKPDGTRVPCFDGPPRRDQTRQGWAGDCGIIAASGAIAAHRPEEITRRIRTQEDGSYQVTLSEVRESDGITQPTGRDIELTVTPELPIYDRDPTAPACAKVQDGAGWCAVMEKAFAGLDQTWTPERRTAWEADWAGLCADDQARNAERSRSGTAPGGYVRLHQGTTPWERAEALTQLTGQPAVVREFPSSGRDEWLINRIIRTQLTDSKPVLVSSRDKTDEHERLPHGLEPGHVYEVTAIEKGQILLRNPWNRDHPQPMETAEFARNMNRYYSTLI